MDAIGQLMLALNCDRVARQPVEVIGCSLKDFCSHHLASFNGRGNDINAENWLNAMEELLATTRCTNDVTTLMGKSIN
jgi:hypothetical protein